MMLNKQRNQRLQLFSSKIFIGLVACVAGAWKSWAQKRTGRTRERHGKERDTERLPHPSRVFLARSVLSCPHYFEAPATQAISLVPYTLACAALASNKWLGSPYIYAMCDYGHSGNKLRLYNVFRLLCLETSLMI